MDDTLGLADASGIPILSSTDDIPVHSTPIKGANVPLPSTKHMMKHLMLRHGRQEDESLLPIRSSDPYSAHKGHLGIPKGQVRGHDLDIRNRDMFAAKHPQNGRRLTKSEDFGGYQDLSNVDNLRPQSRDHPPDKAFHHERANSPNLGQGRAASPKSGQGQLTATDKIPDYRSSLNDEKFSAAETYRSLRNIDGIPKQHEKYYTNREETDPSNKKSGQYEKDKPKLPEDSNNNAYSSSRNRRYSFERDLSARRYESTSRELEKRNERSSKKISEEEKVLKIATVTQISGDFEKGAISSVGTRVLNSQTDGQCESEERTDVRLKTSRFVEDIKTSPEVKRPTIHSPSADRRQVTKGSRSLSISKQNSSFCELENTTLQKQRQEITLLMTELKDRDRELSDMVASHQQQLIAWEQDRDRLATLDKKCLQFEEDLRMKTAALRTYVANLKTMKTKEVETLREIDRLRSTVNTLTNDNEKYKTENEELQRNTASLKGKLDDMCNKVEGLQTREQELTTALRLKEKDISSATSHMKELSDRLQQLDLRCKECQDHEREAIRERNDWKHRYDHTKDELHTLTDSLEKKRTEATRLSEENRSARQQLALIQKEAAMMEQCKDEVIESIRIKQERTDAQLKNFRELYERQLKEVASLQLQLDTSKEARHRRQNSCDDQQLNGSYHGRNSQMSEYSWERSNGSQRQNQSSRNNKSPVQQARYREPNYSQHTQSSGYQSQLIENQTTSGNQATAQTGCDKIHQGSQSSAGNQDSSRPCSRNQYHENLSGTGNQGSNQTGSYLSGTGNQGSNQTGSYLSGTGNQGSNQTGSYLTGTGNQGSNQTGSYLSGTGNQGSNQTGSYLSGTGNQGSNQTGSYLSGTGNQGSNQTGSYLSGTGNQGSNQTGSYLSGTGNQGSSRNCEGNQSQRYSIASQHGRPSSSLDEENQYASNRPYEHISNLTNTDGAKIRYQEHENQSQGHKKSFETSETHSMQSNKKSFETSQPKSSLYTPGEQLRYLHLTNSGDESKRYSSEFKRNIADYKSVNEHQLLSDRNKDNVLPRDLPGSPNSKQASNMLGRVSPKPVICDKYMHSNSPPRAVNNPRPVENVSSPVRQGGYVIQDTQLEVYSKEKINTYQPQSQIPTMSQNPDSNSAQKQEYSSSDRESRTTSDTRSHSPNRGSEALNRLRTHSQPRSPDTGLIRESIHFQLHEKETVTCRPSTDGEVEDNVRKSLDFDEEFEKRYTFENKLCSFLEDLDDIDDSIWDDKPPSTINNLSTTSMGESSPASKLRKLLIESQQMIQSLEKSADSPKPAPLTEVQERTAHRNEASGSTETNVENTKPVNKS